MLKLLTPCLFLCTANNPSQHGVPMKKNRFQHGLLLILSFLSISQCSKKELPANGTDGAIAASGATSVSAQITAENGGRITLGNIELIIPEGALDADTQIGAQYDSGANPEEAIAVSQAVKFSPEGLQFVKPAQLKICYTENEMAAKALNEKSAMVYYKDNSGELLAISGNVDNTAHCVTSAIEHFSTYLAAAQALVPGNAAPTVGGANFLPTAPLSGIPVRVRTTINDFNGGTTRGTIAAAFLNYRVVGAPTYTKVALQPDSTDSSVTNRYYAMIPASSVTLAGIQYFFEATDNLGKKRTTTTTTRTITSSATALRYNPTAALNISAGFSRDLNLQARNSGGTWVNISADSFAVTGSIGTATRSAPSSVRFSAITAGTGSLTATSGALNAALTISVQPGLLNRIEILDSSQVIITGTVYVPQNATYQFDAMGYDAFGNTSIINPVFALSGGIGSFSTSALFTAGPTAGMTGTLTADLAGVTDVVNIAVGLLSPAKDITAFGIPSGGVTIGANTVDVTVPFGTDVSSLVATFTTTGASINIAGVTQISGATANNYSSPLIFTVVAADGSTKDYTVTVTPALNPAKDITAFTIPGGTGMIGANTVDITLPFGTNLSALIATFATTGASINVAGIAQVSGVSSNNFSSPVIYTVRAADGSTKDYTVTVTQALNPAKDMTTFSILGYTSTIGTSTIYLPVPPGTNLSNLVATFTTTGVSVNVGGTTQISGVTANNFSTQKTYTVVAADGTTKDYNVTLCVTTLIGGTSTCALSTNALVTTLAGNGPGNTDGIGIAATFDQPGPITSDGTNLYVFDSNNYRIRKIVIASGAVTTLAGSVPGYVDSIGTAAAFNLVNGITTDGSNLYVSDSGNHCIRQIVINTGAVTTLAGGVFQGNTDGVGGAASFDTPAGITTDGTYLYVVDSNSMRIRKIVIATGSVTTFAGNGNYSSADGTGNAASFMGPVAITTDGINLFVTEQGSHRIRKIVIASAIVTTIAGSIQGFTNSIGTNAAFNFPMSITTDGANLYVTDMGNQSIRKINILTTVVTTLAGGTDQGYADGIAGAAVFDSPYSITTDGTNLFVADLMNNRIRRIQ